MDKLPELCEQGRAVDRVKVMSGLLMQSIGVVPRNHPSLICVGGGFLFFVESLNTDHQQLFYKSKEAEKK